MDKLKREVKASQVYDNCKMLSPQGVHMANVPEKRMRWYLKRDLAKQIDSCTFQLLFEPGGEGHARDVDYQLESRPNLCVVCGIEENLTLHHIIPRCYRRYMPEKYKSRNCFDVVCICHECHDAYERIATQHKTHLCRLFDIEQHPSRTPEQKKAQKTLSLIGALTNHIDEIPPARVCEMENYLSTVFGMTVTAETLDALPSDKIEQLEDLKNQSNPAAPLKVLESYVQKYSLFEFILMWREHFLAHAAPRYLSKTWLNDYRKRKY